MLRIKKPWIGPLVALVVIGAIACADSKSTEPEAKTDPIEGRVQVRSPDAGRVDSTAALGGDGFFRGSVMGYSEADFPDTLKSAKPLAGVVVTAYPAELTNTEPKLGAQAAAVTTAANGQFTFPTLPGHLYVVTFAPPNNSPYESAWTIATAHSGSGAQPWTIMLRSR